MTETTTPKTTRASVTKLKPAPTNESSDYVVPIVGVHVPSVVVDVAFWGGLAGAVALGVVKPPVGALVGAGVLVARHQIRTHFQSAAG
jgi:hypothetical protein